MSVIESVINWCEEIADNEQYQYSQDANKRWGLHSRSNPPFYYDCSSFVSDAFRLFNDVGYDFTRNFTAYTGTMREIFMSNGYFADVTKYGVIKRGDVLLTHTSARQHVCIYTGTTDTNNNVGTVKKTVQAIGRAYGIQKDYDDSKSYQYILRYVGRPPKWHAKKKYGYNKGSDGLIDNARMILNTLSDANFTLEAVCGILGNMYHESGLNPFRWQSDDVLAYGSSGLDSTAHGYGLVQLTKARPYFDIGGRDTMSFSDRNGKVDADSNLQMDVIANDRLNKYNPFITERHTPEEFKVSWSDFKNLTDLRIATGAWLWGYEFPSGASSKLAQRLETANYFYNLLSGYSPQPPQPPTPTDRKKLPIWLIYKIIERSN